MLALLYDVLGFTPCMVCRTIFLLFLMQEKTGAKCLPASIAIFLAGAPKGELQGTFCVASESSNSCVGKLGGW